MGTNTLFFILGAPDPEMAAIEELLRAHRIPVAYAAVRNCGDAETLCRVKPFEAYKAEATIPEIVKDPTTQIVRVECEFVGEAASLNDSKLLDHHRPGDPGYGKDPKKYWEASSLGQVLKLLYPRCNEFHENLKLVAAADHCLAAAYRGKCPGVDPDELMRWRISSRAKFQGRSEEEILRDVEAARDAIRMSRKILVHYFDPEDREDLDGKVLSYANFLDIHVPELPEAAAREGVCFVSTLQDGRTVCQAGSPDHIKAFLDGYVVGPLRDSYGDPERGFAGGKTCKYHRIAICTYGNDAPYCQEVIASGECPMGEGN